MIWERGEISRAESAGLIEAGHVHVSRALDGRFPAQKARASLKLDQRLRRHRLLFGISRAESAGLIEAISNPRCASCSPWISRAESAGLIEATKASRSGSADA